MFTFGKDLGDLGVAGAEGAVDLEAVGVIEEGAAEGEEHFLRSAKRTFQRSHANHQSVLPKSTAKLL